MSSALTILRGHRVSIVVIMALAVVASSILTFLRPFEYRTSFSLLVIEKQGSLDGYAAAKSAERLSTSLSQVIYTASFANQVYDRLRTSGGIADSTLFSQDEQIRREQWKRHIEIRLLPNVGQIKIAVYDPDRSTSSAVANALAAVLVEQGTDYLGGSSDVVLKLVDFPLTSKRPARPNITVNLFGGLVLGFLGAWSYYMIVARLRELSPEVERHVEHREIAQEPWEPIHTPIIAERVTTHVPNFVEPKKTAQSNAPQNLPVSESESIIEDDLPYFDRDDTAREVEERPAPAQNHKTMNWQMP